MERLVTTSQAAQILGISLQGVHYRIKKNKLKSIKQGGKTFVYIDETQIKEKNPQENLKVEPISVKQITQEKTDETYKEVLKVKDEQIDLLKKSMKWMKKQYISEISRLEKNQKRIIEVFNSEIKLLQSAFNEMRSIYKPKIEEKPKVDKKEENEFISLKDFSILMKRNHKTQNEIKLIILRAIKNGDKRFIYNKVEKKLLILNSDFKDLI